MIESIMLIIITIFLLINIIKYFKTKESNNIIEIILETLSVILLVVNSLLIKEKNITIKILVIVIGLIIPIIIEILTFKKINIIDIYYNIKLSNNSIKTRNYILNKISKTPISSYWHKKLAKYYENNKQYEKAEEEYFYAIEQKPDELSTYYELVEILKKLNKKDEQIKILEELTLKDNQNEKAKMMLGIAYYENNQYKEALNLYQKMIKSNIRNYDLYYNMAMTYTMLNDFLSAKENYEKAAKLNSYKSISNLSIGQINMILRDYEEAKKYFFEEKESEDEKISAYAYYYLAKIAIIEGNIESAIIYTNTALEIYPPIKSFIEKELRFKIIFGKVNLQYKEIDEIKTNIKNKEEKIVDYLEKIYNKVDTLQDNIEHQYKLNEEITKTYQKEKEK